MPGCWAALRPTPRAGTLPAIDPQALAVWALQFSPRVAGCEEAVLLEVMASARLFGGLPALRQRVQDEAAALGVRCVAWAPTGSAALALARAAAQADKYADLDAGAGVDEDAPAQPDDFVQPLTARLDRLPLQVLSAVAQHQPLLARLGCRSLGDVRRLPRAGLSRRCGPALIQALDQAYGLQPEAYAWVQAPPHFEARLALMAHVDTAPALLFAARRLLLQMGGWLVARQAGVAAFTLHWHHEEAAPGHGAPAGGQLTVRTAEATRDVERLARLLGEHLARLQLDAPADTLVLRADEIHPLAPHSHSLLPEAAPAGESTAQVLERIQARLGPGRVRRPTRVDDHRLAWMQHWQPIDAADPARARGARVPVPTLPLPTWVLDEPLRLAVRAHRPQYQGPLQLLLGPDRIEGGWWHRAPGAPGAPSPATHHVERDYWIAHSPRAGLLWIYQQRLGAGEPGWFLHGHFA